MKMFFAVLTVGLFLASCGASIGKLSDDLQKCAEQCGVDIAVDALACPLKGGSYKDLMDTQVQKGMAVEAATCVLQCLGSSVDITGAACGD
jgi:hypothetical protein